MSGRPTFRLCVRVCVFSFFHEISGSYFIFFPSGFIPGIIDKAWPVIKSL